MIAHSAEEVAGALLHVPPDDRELWLRMAMAVKSELGDDGFNAWDQWSQTAGSYKERDAISVWRSIRSGSVGIGSLFYEARQNGWQRCGSKPAPQVIHRKPPPKPQASTGAYALSILRGADWTTAGTHPYSLSKGIDWPAGAARGPASGRVIGQNVDCIIAPIRDISTNAVRAIQCINPAGDKQTFGQLSGNAFICGNTLNKSIRWFVVEGWADAVSMVFHHYKGDAVALAACGKGSMERLANRVAETFVPDEIIILEDAA